MPPIDAAKAFTYLRLQGVELGRVYFYQVLPSTQDEAKRLALGKAPEGTVVIAARQTKGRGRFGRTWFSPPGAGLYGSVVLRPPCPKPRWPTISVLVGIAVVEELRRLGVGGAALKWPNDVVIGNRKVTGILAEAFPDEGFVILGVGINVSFRGVTLPPEIADRAGDLEPFLPKEADLEMVAARLFASAIRGYRNALPDLLLDPKRASSLLWTRSEVEVEGVRGRVVGLMETGELLLVRRDGSEVAIGFGEVANAPGD